MRTLVCLMLLGAVWGLPLLEDTDVRLLLGAQLSSGLLQRMDEKPELLDEAMVDGPDDSPDWTLGKGEAPSGVKTMPGEISGTVVCDAVAHRWMDDACLHP